MVRAMTRMFRSPWESTGIGPEGAAGVAAAGVDPREAFGVGVTAGVASASVAPADGCGAGVALGGAAVVCAGAAVACAGVAAGCTGAPTLGSADAPPGPAAADRTGLAVGTRPSPVAGLDQADVRVAAALEPMGATKATTAGAIVVVRLPGSAALAPAATQNAARPASSRATQLRMLI